MKSATKKWKCREIIMLLERLEMYLSAGLDIVRALRISEEGVPPRQKMVLTNLRSYIESGGTLSKGLREHLGISETISGLIQQGESSGSLSKSLFTARQLMEKEDELYKKCVSALTYPAVIGVFACLLTIGLVRGVMSQIIPMLRSLHADLPLITRVVIWLSEALTKGGVYILIGSIAVAVGLKFSLKKSAKIRSLFHSMLIRIPIFGRLIHNYFLAVFLHSCGALIESGLSSKESYSKTASMIALLPLRSRFEEKVPLISEGQTMGSIVSGKNIPAYITALLNAGEASGTLGISILRAGNILDKEIDHSLKKLTALIEPVMMVGMGGVVGSIAISIMMPIYSISTVLQK